MPVKMKPFLLIFLVMFSLVLIPQISFAKAKKITSGYCLGHSYKAFKKRTSKYDKAVRKYSKKYGVSSALIKSVITAESCFNSRAVSPKGAQGLMQLMPATARRFGVSDSFDTDANIRGGTRYLNFLLRHFKNDLLSVIAAYNAGEGAVRKYKGIPPYKETRNYVSKVSTLYKFYSKGGGERGYDHLSSGNFTNTFFVPRGLPKSKFSPYKNRRRNIIRGNCANKTSTNLRRNTKVEGGQGIWQRVYTAKEGETLGIVSQKTGINKMKIMRMNGLRFRTRLRRGQRLLVWECRK